MDSMRSLNTSLPTSSSSKSQPSEQLLQIFKSAALQVTNLYKTAATGQTQARQSGYQDALDDLLTFLDKENLGLGDGEGWKVRTWATERLDGNAPAQSPIESDDDGRVEVETRARSSSPATPRKESRIHQTLQVTRSTSPTRTESAPPTLVAATPVTTLPPPATLLPKTEAFTFRSGYSLPAQQDTDMNASDPDNPSLPSHTGQQDLHCHNAASSTSSVRVEVIPRHTRAGGRHAAQVNKGGHRSSAPVSNLGSGAGYKRRMPFGEYFDIGTLGNGKDNGTNGGGGKRGRFT